MNLKESPYFPRVRELLRILPYIGEEKSLAIKGGTAINLFVRDLPRLSVDIDLAYLPIESRSESLGKIRAALVNIAAALKKYRPEYEIQNRDFENGKMMIGTAGGLIKIEVNTILRGSVFDPTQIELSRHAQELFEMEFSITTLSMEDLYGGKICAALDRQHPRDLFDIFLLYEDGGLTDNIRKAFIVYLLSHNRPIHELLDPRKTDFTSTFQSEFEGLTERTVTQRELEETFDKLIADIRRNLTQNERQFILTFKRGKPDWGLFSVAGVERLPGIQWKLKNIAQMEKSRHENQMRKLERVLGASP
ncbi:MAG TPA: nucleotidyl transferase AbiEii/AbiGii toxin family protein [Bdellovibrionota bacterium]|nr:nucleotidyl transferase AbiEii/AbiGii toxin family protein [Bdellovibrionota bacterium]